MATASPHWGYIRTCWYISNCKTCPVPNSEEPHSNYNVELIWQVFRDIWPSGELLCNICLLCQTEKNNNKSNDDDLCTKDWRIISKQLKYRWLWLRCTLWLQIWYCDTCWLSQSEWWRDSVVVWHCLLVNLSLPLIALRRQCVQTKECAQTKN